VTYAVITTFDDSDFGVGLSVFTSREKAEKALADLKARDDHHVSGFATSYIQEQALDSYEIQNDDGDLEEVSL
jgi:hypothetical protein